MIFYTVPGKNISERNLTLSGLDAIVTLDLPITEFVPINLSIISTVSPSDTAPVTADFPSSYQYTLTFTDLNPGVDYSYTVQVVFHNIVVATFSGSFSTALFCEFIKFSF